MKAKQDNDKLIEFAATAQNEKESQAYLQLVRPKEGRILEYVGNFSLQFAGAATPHYEYKGSQILYLSDLHLDRMVDAAKCKTSDDVQAVLLEVGQELEFSYEEYVSCFSDGNVVVLIDGDIAHSPDLFKAFAEMNFRFMKNAIIVLGNHELWAYPGLSIEEIAAKYSKLSPVPVVQNEIIVFEDKPFPNGEMLFLQQFVQYRATRISYETALNMSADELSKQMSSARMIMLAGIGFSGCNEQLNADNGIYLNTLSREQEIFESRKFELIYDHFLEATRSLKDRVLVVATHMPLESWKAGAAYEDEIVYISGHTHRNYFYDDGVQRIYADNQNGYYGRHPIFKCVYTDDVYDPFNSYSDGIYEIKKADYLMFYLAKKMHMQMKREYKALYMLKKNGYYCFLVRLASGTLSILNGGRVSRLKEKNVEFYYEGMDQIINRISSPLEQYTNLQKKVSDAVKAFGGTGRIHGCIVDIDFYNHVFINPLDLTIKSYYAFDVIRKWVYDSVPDLLKDHAPELYKKYQILMKSNSESALAPLKTELIATGKSGVEYFNTDIYVASREISKIQKLTNNILSFWNDELLEPEGKYIEAPKK